MRAVAYVPTDAADRYAKQLLSHLGRKRTVTDVEGVPAGGRLVFPDGACVVRPEEQRLVLEATADTDDGLAHVQDVVRRHLERFGVRRELVVDWQVE